jgi:hypothetical protein
MGKNSTTTEGDSPSIATEKEHGTKAFISMKKSLDPGKLHSFTPEKGACLYSLAKRDLFRIEILNHFKECYPSSTRTGTQVSRKARTLLVLLL